MTSVSETNVSSGTVFFTGIIIAGFLGISIVLLGSMIFFAELWRDFSSSAICKKHTRFFMAALKMTITQKKRTELSNETK